jgi:hypothetical protein
MNATQVKWLRDNGIQVRGEGQKRTFSKGATGLFFARGKWELETQDCSEDGDGGIHLGSFTELKEGLAALRKV